MKTKENLQSIEKQEMPNEEVIRFFIKIGNDLNLFETVDIEKKNNDIETLYMSINTIR
jgi:hypothetical protein